jgi:hypothetical protein
MKIILPLRDNFFKMSLLFSPYVLIAILCLAILIGCATGPSQNEKAHTWLNQQYAEGKITPEMYLLGQDMIAQREAENRAAGMTAAALLMQQGQATRQPYRNYDSGVIMTPGQPFTYWWGKAR